MINGSVANIFNTYFRGDVFDFVSFKTDVKTLRDVFGNYEHQETSAIDEMLTNNDFLTYNDKYIGGGKGKLK